MIPANEKSGPHPGIWVFSGLFGLYLLLFIQYPLSGKILGIGDAYTVIGWSSYYANAVKEFFTGEFTGMASFPTGFVRYGASGVGATLPYILLNSLLRLPGLWTYHVYLALLFASSGLCVFLFARLYVKNTFFALAAALFFINSGHIWANIDDAPWFLYTLPVLSAFFLKKALTHKNFRHLLWAGAIGGLQSYFLLQLYVYQSIIIAALLASYAGFFWRQYTTREKLAFAGLYLLIPQPLIGFYLYTALCLEVNYPWDPVGVVPRCSLQARHLLTALEGRIISWPFVTSVSIPRWGFWPALFFPAFPGLGLPALALAGVCRSWRKYRELWIGALAGLLFAMGPTLRFAGMEIPSPVGLLYDYIPFFRFVRVAARGYAVFLFCVSVLAAIGLKNVFSWVGRPMGKYRPLVFLALVLFVLLENVSWPLNRFVTVDYPSLPRGYAEFFEDKPQAVILDLPENAARFPMYVNDFVYVLWQTQHKRNILGGGSGYHSVLRSRVSENSRALPDEGAVAFFRDLGLTHIIIHASPSLYGTDRPTYQWMESHPLADLAFQTEEMKVYRFLPSAPNASKAAGGQAPVAR